ncbi:hypothetical protein F5Y16DRAFT_397622 [Xylariaceae sp. FL0255]|nr:hypothetical protein F5Y16DRAFT_397622 [Xylariaceae sp. FL0255]
MKSDIVKVIARPFRATYQAWNGFKTGRKLRKLGAQREQTASPDNEHSGGDITKSTKSGNSAQPSLQTHNHQSRDHQGHKKEGWTRQKGEYPWRIEQLVHEDDNTRGTWVLEMKDMSAVVWEKEYQMKGSRLKMETIPQPHWPFPRHLQGNNRDRKEPDELLNWLDH